MKICLAGLGAFGRKHMEALLKIDEVELVSIVGSNAEETSELAKTARIAHWTTDLEECLQRSDVEAVILATPTPLHGTQAIQCLKAGKHVMIEIPMADGIEDCENIVRLQQETGLVAMVGHTRRFNPSHQWVRRRITDERFRIHHLQAQTYFLRRSNTNALGQPRSWTDHLLWHHACHTVDLFQYQTGEVASAVHGIEGPVNPDLGISMDMSIQLKVPSGAICTLSLSFNNDGPYGSTFRYIGDTGTYVARYDALEDGYGNSVDVSEFGMSSNGVELQDREFIAAIVGRREPNASVAQCLPAMHTLDRIQSLLLGNRDSR